MVKGEYIAFPLEVTDGCLRIFQLHVLAFYLPHHYHPIGMSIGQLQIALAQPIAVERHFEG